MKLAYLVKKFPRLSETFVLGEIAEQTGARTAILVMGGIGFVAMAWWLRTHGEVLDMVRED